MRVLAGSFYLIANRVNPPFYIYAGIGRATAKALAQHGAEVLALSRTSSDLESLKREVPSCT